MIFSKKEKIASRIDTLIGGETEIEGDVQFSCGLRVDGTVRGNVTESELVNSTIVLSERGVIEGTVTASRIMLNGRVVGPIYAKDYLELQPKSRVVGDIHYKTMEIHTGAVIEGNLIYQGEHEIKLLTNKD